LSIFVEKDGKKTISRAICVKFLVFMALIGLSVFLMQPLQAFISREMQNIRNNLIENLENYTGLEIRYSSIRPAFFGSFDIRNLGFYKDDAPFFTVYRIQINFSLIEFLLNKKTFVRTVILERPSMNIDMGRDRDTLDLFISLIEKREVDINDNTSVQDLADFLPRHADYQIRNGNFSFVDKDFVYLMRNINLNIQEDEGDIFFNGILSAEYRQSGFDNKTVILRTEIGINGTSDDKLQEGKGEVSISYITYLEHDQKSEPVSLFTVHPFSIALLYDDYTLTVKQKDNDEDNSVNYLFQYNTETGNISAEAAFMAFQLSDKINFSGYLRDANHLLNMQINGDSWFKLDNGNSTYNVNITGGNMPAVASSRLTDAFIIRAWGNNNTINIRDFQVSSSSSTARAGLFQGRAGYSGTVGLNPIKPSGNLFFDRFSLNDNSSFTADFNVLSSNREIQISSEIINIANTQLNNFDIFLYPSERDIAVSVSFYSDDDSAVFLDAVYNRNPGQLEASVFLDSMSVYNLSEVTRPFTAASVVPAFSRRFLHNSRINTEVFFSTDFKNFVYNAPSINFNLGQTHGMLSLSGTDKQFNLSEGVIRRDDNDLLLSANVNFSNPMDLVFGVKASFDDLAWHVEGQLLDRATLIVRDPNGLHVYGNLDSSGAMSGYIEGINFPIPVNTGIIYLNFYSTLRYTSMDFWNLDVNRFTASDINAENEMEYLRISGSADQDGARFRQIVLNDSVGVLAGSADFSWDHDFSYLEFIVNITDGYEAGEFYHLEGVLKDEQINVRATLSNLHLNRFTKGNTPIVISADAALSYDSIEYFNANVNLSSFSTKIAGEDVHASVGLIFTNDELSIRNLRLDYGEVRTVLPQLELNREEGIVRAKADFQGIAYQRNFEGKIDLDLNFGRINTWLDIMQASNNFNGTLSVEDIQYGHLRHDKLAFNFSSDNGDISLSGGINNMIRLEMDRDGSFFLGLSSPVPVRGTFIGTLKKGILDSHCNNFFIDLSTLYSLVDLGKEFNVASGFIVGEMDIRGPVTNPEFFGTGRSSSLRLQVPDFISEDIRVVPFNVFAEGYEITFDSAVAMCGTGGGNVEGLFLFQNWAPVIVELDINIPRANPIPYDFNITGFLASGNAAGNLYINVDTIIKNIELKGNLFTNDADLGMNMDEIGSIPDSAPKYSNVIELTVTTGTMIEFIWPTTNPIIRANPEMGTVIDILSDSQAGQFSLISDVKIRSGELNYIDRIFYIRQGSIVFREDETDFNPMFSARAEIRDRVDSGPVTISMIVDNQPLLSFVPRFEAYPSLTQLEIYSILGHNFISLQGEDGADQMQRLILSSTTDFVTQIFASSEVMSQFVFFRQFERQVRDTLGLDMFSVRTKVLNNMVISGVTGLGAMGQPPVDGGVGFSNLFDNTTVFVGKYIGQHMFIHGMLTMRYDENSMVFGGLRFEPDIGIELQSPFVNIRWDFFPYHPENFWVNDNSITLSWSMSF